MKKFWPVIASVLFIVFLTGNGSALPKYGVSELASPNKEYTLKLVDTADPWTYELKILRHGVELAHYPFLGELVSAYWSPSLQFVAIDNNYAHGGTYVWIVSLSDGSVVTSRGTVRDQNYDRYSDYHYFFDLPDEAGAELKKIYPGLGNDELREGYTSVAYGWRCEGRLLMFHELPFDNFYPKKDLIIQAYTISKVTNHAITLKSVSFRKVRDQPYEPMPNEVKKTLNFTD